MTQPLQSVIEGVRDLWRDDLKDSHVVEMGRCDVAEAEGVKAKERVAEAHLRDMLGTAAEKLAPFETLKACGECGGFAGEDRAELLSVERFAARKVIDGLWDAQGPPHRRHANRRKNWRPGPCPGKAGVLGLHGGCLLGEKHEFIIERRLIAWEHHEK
jgi:hypothetical protein